MIIGLIILAALFLLLSKKVTDPTKSIGLTTKLIPEPDVSVSGVIKAVSTEFKSETTIGLDAGFVPPPAKVKKPVFVEVIEPVEKPAATTVVKPVTTVTTPVAKDEPVSVSPAAVSVKGTGKLLQPAI